MDILDLISHGARSVAANDDPHRLRDAAERFLKVYVSFRGYGVVAASPQAERVLGAAMMMDPDLHGARGGPTVILDVNIASGTLMARAAKRLRESGNAERLVGVALQSLVRDPAIWTSPELSELIVADQDESASSPWQRTEGCDDGVVLAC